MKFSEYQEKARRTQNDALTINMKRQHALYGLAGEVGEVLSIYQKELQGHPVSREKVLEEAGDCLWMLAELCDSLGASMDELAEANIQKLLQRYPNRFDPFRSLHREK